MTRPAHTHVCPACGKKYRHKDGTAFTGGANEKHSCGHYWFLACSVKCAEHLDALERYLRTRGL